MNYRINDTNLVEVTLGNDVLHLRVYDNYVHAYIVPAPMDLVEIFPAPSVYEPKVADLGDALLIEAGEGTSIRVDAGGNIAFLDGERPFLEPVLEREGEGRAVIRFGISPDAKIYGLGDKMAPLNKRGYAYVNKNNDDPHPQNENFESLYKSINYLLVRSYSRFYGLYFPSTYPYDFDLGKKDPDSVRVGVQGCFHDFYVFFGDTPAKITSAYSGLVGHPYFIRMKMLGNQQSRWSYGSEAAVREVAAKYEENGLPLDYIHLDIDYMDGYRDFTVDKTRFPDLRQLSRDLYAKGIGLVCINDAGIKVDSNYDVYQKCIAEGWEAKYPGGESYVGEVWPGDSVFPSYGNDECRAYFTKKATEFVGLNEIDGIWNDMNEPASFKGPLPDDILFKGNGRMIRHDEFHNAFAEAMDRSCFGVYETFGRRPYVFTRAALATTAKYAFAWNGDNHSLWHHLRLSIPQILSMGLSGFAFDGVDVGGFCGDCNKELLIRWCEGNILMPFFRNHSAIGTRSQEPYAFDEETTATYRKFLELRYRFIPYLYTLARQTSQRGLPIVRPMFFDYYDEEQALEINDQYMIGQNVLMAPILEQGQKARSVYLPKGTWFDYFTGKAYEGGRYILVELELDETAVFVRGGTILPEFEGLRHIDKPAIERIVYRVFGEHAIGFMYEDDGDTLRYRENDFNEYRFECHDSHFTSRSTHRYQSPFKEIKIIRDGNEAIIPFDYEFGIDLD